ncbi:Uncharacterised protein [Kluyvera cryocrescens]|uniref:Terminase n=1 Tax=Kluyvera cryocrescens TaxID=580 RepID=A0A485AJR2_KLUCR|nr:Uncharacterised protein [Kluyvera cryocrescens]
MATPAQRHAMRVSAIKASQRENAPLRHASAYEQMLVKLAADRRTLSDIRSKERKADKKRELLPLVPAVGRWRTGERYRRTG